MQHSYAACLQNYNYREEVIGMTSIPIEDVHAIEKYCNENSILNVHLVLYSGTQVLLLPVMANDQESTLTIKYHASSKTVSETKIDGDDINTIYAIYKNNSSDPIRKAYTNKAEGVLNPAELTSILGYNITWDRGLHSLQCSQLMNYLQTQDISYFAFVNTEDKYELYIPIENDGILQLSYPRVNGEAKMPDPKIVITYSEPFQTAVNKKLFSSSDMFARFNGHNLLSIELLSKMIKLLKK